MSHVATKDGSFRLRVATSKLEKWREASVSEGLSLSRWVEEACDAALADVNALNDEAVKIRLERSELVARTTPQKKPRSGLCEHRVPADSFCPRCL